MNRLLLLFCFLLLLMIGACATPEPIVKVEDDDTQASEIIDLNVQKPVYGVFQTRERTLYVTYPGTETADPIGRGGVNIFSSQSTNSPHIALAVSDGLASSLYVFNSETGRSHDLFSGAPDAVYSGVWDPNGSAFYFGQYKPDGKRMGAGSIHRYDIETGRTTKVPCTASRLVLGVRPEGSLWVRNSDEIYEVDKTDCATINTVDARKLYHVTASPDGSQVVYILRDLVFNSETREYDPDSTLYLDDFTGAEPLKIVGDKYEPRNMRWSPDGSELAYDVLVPGASGKRAISIYTIFSGDSAYLEPPEASPYSSSRPEYSPTGRHILYSVTSADGLNDVMWRTEGDSFAHGFPDEAVMDSTPRFEWVGNDQVFLDAPTGASIVDISTGTGVVKWSEPGVYVYAFPLE